jgi:hypothetical protein
LVKDVFPPAESLFKGFLYTMAKIAPSESVLKNTKKYFVCLKPANLAHFSQ